jgi:hypothetical protein
VAAIGFLHLFCIYPKRTYVHRSGRGGRRRQRFDDDKRAAHKAARVVNQIGKRW